MRKKVVIREVDIAYNSIKSLLASADIEKLSSNDKALISKAFNSVDNALYELMFGK